MARQGISREQVYEAAGALLEEGAPPTVQAVRERLGTGSSPSTGIWRSGGRSTPGRPRPTSRTAQN